jgi:hypothetical protein
MRDFETAIQQRQTMELMRRVAAQFPERNVTTFMILWLFGDQYSVILPNTLQNIGIAMACMVAISLLLIPQPLCAFWVAVCIASIDTGVVGYMTLWGVNLDAISMITIIMSIGFSVDFSAHISYGYVISDEDEPAKRVCQALGALGWPIMQGALSTIFGVAVLSTVDAYMIVTFFKTVFLVISLGAIHGLIFLPVLLSIFVQHKCFALSRRKEKLKAERSLRIAVQETEEPENDAMHPFGPFGRYGIYLPRLSHCAEYYPGKGDVFAWSGGSFGAGTGHRIASTVHFGPAGRIPVFHHQHNHQVPPMGAPETAVGFHQVVGSPQVTIHSMPRQGFNSNGNNSSHPVMIATTSTNINSGSLGPTCYAPQQVPLALDPSGPFIHGATGRPAVTAGCSLSVGRNSGHPTLRRVSGGHGPVLSNTAFTYAAVSTTPPPFISATNRVYPCPLGRHPETPRHAKDSVMDGDSPILSGQRSSGVKLSRKWSKSAEDLRDSLQRFGPEGSGQECKNGVVSGAPKRFAGNIKPSLPNNKPAPAGRSASEVPPSWVSPFPSTLYNSPISTSYFSSDQSSEQNRV